MHYQRISHLFITWMLFIRLEYETMKFIFQGLTRRYAS